MTTNDRGRGLLVALAILGVAILSPAVGAHGTGPTATDRPPSAAPQDGKATDWADWMAARMTEHVGPGAVEWMEAHTGATVDGMALNMADGDGPDGHGIGANGPGTGMYGQGGCCL